MKKRVKKPKTEIYYVKAMRMGAGFSDSYVKIYIPHIVAEELGIRHGAILKITRIGKKLILKKYKDPEPKIEHQTEKYLGSTV